MTRTLTPIALTSTNFADFGDVVEARGEAKPINYGQTKRYHDLASVDVTKNNGKALVNIFRSTPLPAPIKIEIMERHPLSSQLFMPLSGFPYLVVVAPKGEFDESRIQVFLATPGQGVNYHAGTWHHYSLALDAISDFLVIDRGGNGDNCDEVRLVNPLIINI